jgi:hypothetical protein
MTQPSSIQSKVKRTKIPIYLGVAWPQALSEVLCHPEVSKTAKTEVMVSAERFARLIEHFRVNDGNTDRKINQLNFNISAAMHYFEGM